MRFDVLGALLACADPPAAGGERHQVLYSPAFHRGGLLEVELRPDGAAICLRIFTGCLWEALAGNGDVRRARTPEELAELVALALPPATEHRAALGPEQAEALGRELARDLVGLGVFDDRCGRDGIGLDVAVSVAGAPTRRYEAWSPTRDLPAHAYFATLHRVVTPVLDEPARAVLEQAHGYLDLGPPVRDDGGSPRRLRIFGRLADEDRRALVALLAVDEDEPVVVDMRNLEVIGAGFYPIFKRFAERRGLTMWVVSQPARRQLREAGVADRHVHHDLGDALLHLTTLAASRSRRPGA